MAESTMKPRFKGQEVELGRDTFVVPPLALGALRGGLLERLRDVDLSAVIPKAETIDLMLEVIGAALRRNYPELTDEQLAELIDLGNLVPVFRTVLGQSSLLRRDGAPVGNGQPGPAAPSSGA